MLKRVLKILGWVIALLALCFVLLVAYVELRWNGKVDRAAPALSAPRDSATVARGEYIFRYQAHCWSCHTNSGGAAGLPSGGTTFDLRTTGPGFGIWYSRNITPDVETGIGGWSDGEIVQALREGVRKDRTVLFPLMPVDWFHGISDADALALVAYLRSLPAVANRVPDQEPSLFAKALFALGVLKPKDPLLQPVTAPPRGPTAAYRRYLAGTVSGCLDCHTPRNLQNGEFFLDSLGAGSSIRFGAAEAAGMASYARNLTPDRETGIGGWSEEQFMAAVTSGMRPDGTVLDPNMPYAYYESCTEDDLRAIFLYFQSLPALRRTVPPTRYSAEFTDSRGSSRGRAIFRSRCQACHGADGKGALPTKVVLAEVAPSISNPDLRDFIRSGDLELKMPSFASTVREDELEDLVAFIRSWEKR